MIPLVYTLRKEVGFMKRRDSWIVVCQAPLNILRIGSSAYAMLQCCDGSKSVHDIAQETGLAEESALKLCDYFSRKAILKTAPVANSGFFPFVSVIIPARNRATDLVACLQSVFAQDYPKEKMEVIVVDDGSQENIGDPVRSLSVPAHHQPDESRPILCHETGVPKKPGGRSWHSWTVIATRTRPGFVNWWSTSNGTG